ncbi:MAG: OmpA family protein [Mariprofundus sp.]|nr:OmpA family protein [Mariprofundus sp.]
MFKLRLLLLTLLLMVSSCSTVDAIFGPDEPEVAVASTKDQIASENDQLGSDVSDLRAQLKQIKQDIADKKAMKAAELARLEAEQQAEQKAKQNAIPKDRLWVTVSFRSGFMELTSDSRAALKRLAAKFLSKDRTQTIEVRGYTDDEPIGGYANSRHTPRHPYKTNLALSQARADNVSDVLIGAGLSSAIVKAVGFGANDYVADNSTDEGRQKNRRSEIHLISQ